MCAIDSNKYFTQSDGARIKAQVIKGHYFKLIWQGLGFYSIKPAAYQKPMQGPAAAMPALGDSHEA